MKVKCIVVNCMSFVLLIELHMCQSATLSPVDFECRINSISFSFIRCSRREAANDSCHSAKISGNKDNVQRRNLIECGLLNKEVI